MDKLVGFTPFTMKILKFPYKKQVKESYEQKHLLLKKHLYFRINSLPTWIKEFTQSEWDNAPKQLLGYGWLVSLTRLPWVSSLMDVGPGTQYCRVHWSKCPHISDRERIMIQFLGEVPILETCNLNIFDYYNYNFGIFSIFVEINYSPATEPFRIISGKFEEFRVGKKIKRDIREKIAALQNK